MTATNYWRARIAATARVAAVIAAEWLIDVAADELPLPLPVCAVSMDVVWLLDGVIFSPTVVPVDTCS